MLSQKTSLKHSKYSRWYISASLKNQNYPDRWLYELFLKPISQISNTPCETMSYSMSSKYLSLTFTPISSSSFLSPSPFTPLQTSLAAASPLKSFLHKINKWNHFSFSSHFSQSSLQFLPSSKLSGWNQKELSTAKELFTHFS